MAGLPFNQLPANEPVAQAGGPMAQQAEREFKAEMDAAGQEYKIGMQALGEQYLTEEQRHNKAARLHEKHSVKALKMKRQWNQRMAMIQQYEKLGKAGKTTAGEAIPAQMTPERVRQEQYEVFGYDVPEQRKQDLFMEHQKLIAERSRMEQYLYDNWGTHWRKTRRILATDSKGKVTKWGDAPTKAEQAQIDMIDERIKSFDQYEFDLIAQMDPQHRKIGQLQRAMGMPPRISGTPGVGKKQIQIQLGIPQEKPERERLETPGYKMTQKKAMERARKQLGDYANKERIIELAKLIFKGVELE